MNTLSNFKFLVLSGPTTQDAQVAQDYYSTFDNVTVTTSYNDVYLSRLEGEGVAHGTFKCCEDTIEITNSDKTYLSTVDQLFKLFGINKGDYSALNDALSLDSESLVYESIAEAVKLGVQPSVDMELLKTMTYRHDTRVDSYLAEVLAFASNDQILRAFRYHVSTLNTVGGMPNCVQSWLKYINLPEPEDFRFNSNTLHEAVRALPQGIFKHINKHRSYYAKKLYTKNCRIPFRTPIIVHGNVKTDDTGRTYEDLLNCEIIAGRQVPYHVPRFKYETQRVNIYFEEGDLCIKFNFPSLTKTNVRTRSYLTVRSRYTNSETDKPNVTDIVSTVLEVFNSYGILLLSYFVDEHLQNFIDVLKGEHHEA